MSAFRIRHCEGHKAAWVLIALRPDGTEIDSYGGYRTALSLDSLIADKRHPQIMPGDSVEFVLFS